MSNLESSFKYLFTEVFKNNGDVSKIPEKLKKTQIKCFVKESYPYFLVTDDFFYVPIYFTKKAVDQFKSKFSNVNITDLKSQVIVITEWHLELTQVNSSNVFTSYAGIELKLIASSFKIDNAKKITLTRQPINIYRDNEIKTLINQFIFDNQVVSVSGALKSDDLPDISKFQSKANVSQGVVKFGSGDTFGYGFKDSKTALTDIAAIAKLEKGAAALKSSEAKAVKPKVVGGVSKKSKAIKKDSGAVAQKIAKFTPGQKKPMAKKSVVRIAGGLPTPGDKKSEAQTTDLQTMKDFKKMVDYIKKHKGKK